jgi:LCP family protein required for cell wall assembly
MACGPEPPPDQTERMSRRNPSYVRKRTKLPPWALGALIFGFLTLVALILRLAFASGGAAEMPVAGQGDGSATVAAMGQPAILPWQGSERVTVLLLGIDERQDEDGPWRTDTMMILTLDPVSKTAGMLSIPRDLWVQIPGYGPDRINTAFFKGDADDYPGGGPALALETAQATFGITIPYYITVNFGAFEAFIDQIGGIEISVPEDIDDPTYPAPTGYGYEPFFLPAGQYHMDGETALKYARTRATFGGDFDRAKRQQQVILAVRRQILRAEMLPRLVQGAPELWATLQGGIDTNLTPEQLLSLAMLAQTVADESIRYEVIDGEYVTAATTADGEQVLVPDPGMVAQLMVEMFSESITPPAGDDLAALAVTERAEVHVLNGTLRPGLALSAREQLIAGGVLVEGFGDASRSDYVRSVIYDYRNKPYSARYVADLLGVPGDSIVPAGSPEGVYDILVILGEDYQPQ